MPLHKEKNATREEIESLTIHGISRVASGKNKYVRMIWLVLCISTSISFGIIAGRSFMKYYQYNTFNHITVKQNSKLALPAITFCHTNLYNPFQFQFEDPPVVQHLPENCSFNDRKYFTNRMNWEIFHDACRMFFGTFKSITSAMGIDMPQYFRFPKGFEITPYGLPCVTLNRNLTLVQQAAGEKYGLHMIMYSQDFNLSNDVFADYPITDSRNGIYAVLHGPKQLVPMGDGIVLPPGYHTHISVTRNIIKRLPHPYPSKCKHEQSSSNSIYPGVDTQQLCLYSCVTKQVYEMCPGVLPELKMFMKAPEFPVQADIYNVSFWQCIINALTQVSYEQCDCRENCYEETYNAIVNRHPWPQSFQVPSLMKLISSVERKNRSKITTSDVRNRLIKISIHYKDFKEHISEEQPLYDFSTIISDLGGQMGLFLGASLLSLAEIIALVVTYARRSLCKRDSTIELSTQTMK